MKNKKTLGVICLIAIAFAAVAFNSLSSSGSRTVARQRTTTSTPAGVREAPKPSQASEHVIYRQFFRHVVALKQRAADNESHGKSGKALREHYKTKMGLKDKHADLLDQIAQECERETAKVDAKAQKIIDDARRRFPDGNVPSTEQLPAPPPELKKLQLKRDMIVMRARHRLVTELGSEGFQQIDGFIKANFAPDVQPVAARPKQMASTNETPLPNGGK